MEQIYRQMYRAQSLAGQADACAAALALLQPLLHERVRAGRLLTASAYRWGEHFFFYYESIARPIDPEELFGTAGEWLRFWPGGEEARFFVPLMDIFHCVEPQGVDHWRRKQRPERVFARLARIKPEMVSSYIFYHYQLQEEQPGGFDKYCLIGIHENLLFFYLEHPFVIELPPAPGKLNTQNTPAPWQKAMDPHFLPWTDAPRGQELWRDTETVFTIA
jgi:hypothetical protein